MPRLRLDSILIFLAFLAPNFLSAQRQLFHAYGSSDGLTNLNVRCLLQDHTGYIWVGTDNGLFRYDGGKFRGFGHSDGLSNTEVISLAESPGGTLWVGTNDGVAVFSGDISRQSISVSRALRTTSVSTLPADVFLEHDSGIIRGMAQSYFRKLPVPACREWRL
jgi:ligand-binding sensor domain-containing protein